MWTFGAFGGVRTHPVHPPPPPPGYGPEWGLLVVYSARLKMLVSFYLDILTEF